MKVELIAKTPNSKKVAFAAIRRCYSGSDFNEIWNNEYDKYVLKDNDEMRLIKQIVSHGHTSTLEHISFSFIVDGVSRALLAQITRHRIGWSYSVQSQRYVNYAKKGKLDYITPNNVSNNVEALKVWNDIHEEIKNAYLKLIDLGIKPEDARGVLGQSTETKFVVSCNLRAFLDFYNKRNPNTHAQEEISRLAETMMKLIVSEEEWIKTLFDLV